MTEAKRALLEKRLRGHSAGQAEIQTIERRTTREQPVPLSFAQQRLWFLYQLEPESFAYNIPTALRLTGRLDVKGLEQSINETIRRHESLRTLFRELDGQPLQTVVPELKLSLTVQDLQHLSAEKREAEAVRRATEEARRPFDLEQLPLVRVRLLRLSEQEHVLLFIIHHIIADGWSMGVLVNEVAALYKAYLEGKASPLAELPIQYTDFSEWQRGWLTGKIFERQLEYWKGQLGGELPVLELPTDRKRPARQSFHGAISSLALPPEMSATLKRLSQQEGATLFMLLLAAFQTLLHRYTHQSEILVGTGIANRNRAELEGLIGFFVNTLVLRTDFSGDPTFRELLGRVREVTLGAYAHQDLPFEKLVEELQPERNLSRNPIFQVTLALQNTPMPAFELPGLTLRTQEFESLTTRFDLEFHLWDLPEGIQGYLFYSTDLFDETTIARLLGHFEKLLEEIVSNPDLPVSRINFLAADERRKLLREWNETKREDSLELCVHQSFEERAQEQPLATAISCAGESVTYAELNRRANQLAHYLRAEGVGPEVCVGIMLERSIEMIVAQLAILKAGGAFVTLDASYPAARLSFMLDDAEALLLITQKRFGHRLSSYQARTLYLDALLDEIASQSEENPEASVTKENLAYVIYTSGSTGAPKGVLVEHGGLSNLSTWHRRVYEVTAADRATHLAGVGFDAAVWELWPYLTAGASVHLVDEEVRVSPPMLLDWLAEQAITICFLPTPLAEAVLAEPLPQSLALRFLLTGGDRLHQYPEPQLSFRLANNYGPTEYTVVTTSAIVSEAESRALAPPIGRPVDNTDVYVLDENLEPSPTGVAGELHIGGAGLARGYLHQPAQTALSFIPHPYSEEAGARLYKTGDLVRYLPDGQLEFIGRLDSQVKVRGFRIELGEIEAALHEHEEIGEATVIARSETSGENRSLVAYVVPSNRVETLQDEAAEFEQQHLSHWQSLYEDVYRQPVDETEAAFNVIGWNSSYTGLPLPAEEMRAWQQSIIEQIRLLNPTNVLEIGCGTGLLLLQLAPHCESYCGTDFSASALGYVQRQLLSGERDLSQVKLLRRMADDFGEIEEGAFDLVILNSVVQYFPDLDYLLRVLAGAFKALKPGGRIFLGDLRNYRLLEAFHASVQLHQASSSLSVEALRKRFKRSVAMEEELLVDPALFHALKEHFPQLSTVEVQLERGAAHNELARFRYHAVLHTADAPSGQGAARVLDWQHEGMTLARLRQLLIEEQPAALEIRRVPNARVLADVRLSELLEQGDASQTAGELLEAASRSSLDAVDPEDVWSLSESVPYAIQARWSENDADCFDALLTRQIESASNGFPARSFNFTTELSGSKPLSSYANSPLRGGLSRRLVQRLRNFLEERLPSYMMPASFVVLDALPLNASGKVDRKALPAPDEAQAGSADERVLPRTAIEALLAHLWTDVLGMESIGVHDDFFELGGHSLLATQLLSRVREGFHVELPLRVLFESPTIAQLASQVEAAMREQTGVESKPLVAVAREQRLPLSFAQQRLWFLTELEPTSSFYNMPAAVRLSGALDIQALKRTLNEIIRRHESLRTSFPAEGGQPRQEIAPALELELAVHDLSQLSLPEREAEALRRATAEARHPFDLAHGPLFRASLLRLREDEHILLVTMHHIISDGWSMSVLVREVGELYRAFIEDSPSTLEELPVQYSDFAVWQREWLTGEVLEAHLSYWKQQLGGELPVLELLTDKVRPQVQTFNGASESLRLPARLRDSLDLLGKREGATLFMALLASFKVLLHRYTGQTDIVVGSPIANRNRLEVENLIGFFVNTLVLRTELGANPSFREVVGRVRAVTLEAYAHQDMPFEQLVEELQPERSMSRNPLFQVMFQMENTPKESLPLPGLTLSSVEVAHVTSQFDLSLIVQESDEGLFVVAEYSTDLFQAETIRRLLQHWEVLLNGIISNPDSRISELPLLSTSERERLLVHWNDTTQQYSDDSTLHALFEAQVSRTPESIALVCDDERLSYAELNERANRLAHYLQASGVGTEALVGLCVERSIEMVVGILAILKAGGAYVPLDPAYPQERLAFMLRDANIQVLLTQEKLLEKLPVDAGTVLCIDRDWPLIAQYSADKPPCSTTADNLIYVIYTSGSTGQPKGTLLTHRNLFHLFAVTHPLFRFDERDVWTLFHSYAFDFSVWELWGALAYGGRLVIVPYFVSRSPAEFYRLLSRERVTVLNQTPSAFRQLMLEAETSTQAQELALRLIIFGGEALDVQGLRPWFTRHGDEQPQLINMYGITETTVHVTYRPLTLSDLDRSSGSVIGRAISSLEIYILDQHQQLAPIGVAGEICVGGKGLARGYLHRAELTAERFIPHPFSREAGARLYRSGDLGRYLPEGEIEYLGRIDQQLKIRGYRIELGEIEVALAEHAGVREAIVLAHEDARGDKRLVSYVVENDHGATSVGELRGYLQTRLPDHMIPSSFIFLDTLPLTANGKLDRKALPAPDEMQHGRRDEQALPGTAVEELLSHLWTDVLGMESIGVHDDFFELGGHSLLATQLLSRVREGFHVELPLRVLFESPTIAQLASQVEAAMRERAGVESRTLLPVAREQRLPLSFAQQRLWFLSELEPSSSFYNMPAAVRLVGHLEPDVLRRALNEIIRRHESLRTSFPAEGGQPRQEIAPALELELAVHDLCEMPVPEREAEGLRLATEEARHPFDLARGPLFRAGLVRLQEDEHILLLTMHHIISDGWSMSVLVREVAALYKAYLEGESSPLEELPVQYADFAVWQREWLRGEVLEAHLSYWKQQLGGELPVLELLTDKVRPQVQTFNGASESLRLPASLVDSLNMLCRQEGVTLFMVLLASFKTLLTRYTGQTDIVVGSPIANRQRRETENLIGFFVNTLVMRTDLSGRPTFREILKRVRETALGAYAHQDMPFEQLVEELQPERSMSRNPLFQVMFQMENTPKEALPLPGLKLSSVEVEHVTSQFDLSLDVMERDEGLFVAAEYSTDLFHSETIAALLQHWEVLLRGIVSNPDSRISELPLLTERERERLLVEQNQTAEQYPQSASIHALFEAQVARTPEAVAVVSEDEQLSYAELNERANRLAHYLRASGVGTETPVGVLLERSAETIVALLAILKAGGAFVPLDSSYPPQRLAFMLEDTQMPLVVTNEKLKTKLPAFRGQVICTDESRELVEQQSAANPCAPVTAQNLAYVIYTSGSTGQPKGVSISHQSLVNHSFAVAESYRLKAQDRILQFASISFDVAVEEIFPTLLNGAAVVFRNERILESSQLLALIEQEQLSLLNLPAPFWNEWVRELALLEPALPPSLRLVVVGSDKVSMDAFAVWRRLYPNVKLINAYGTSETTITNTLYQTAAAESEAVPGTSVPIGRPLANTQVYLLNEALQPVPRGVPGELYVGESALARGYLNRPALTAERFIPDPFSTSQGARMYRTGDRARYLSGGQLEFLGRLDQQVKLRGYRIEPGEIEARLKLHPSIREAVVVPHAQSSGDKHLIAYVTQNPVVADTLDKSEIAKMEEEQLAQWQMVHDDEVFNQTQALADPEFNISGWNSSYTGLPIPAEEMREWVDDAVERILNERPRRVLEIGCGTGLLLFRLAPHCEAYLGTDFSPAALKYVEQQLSARVEKLPQVSLLERRADDFQGLEAHSFDMVILNSVVQYFPGLEYLLNVLEGAVGAVAPGGSIFIGDVRSLPLLEAFHATVELHKADPSLSLEELRRRIRRSVMQEEELVLDPALFMALRERFPDISSVEIMPKRGRHHNELTQFRYQVMIHVGDKRASTGSLDWMDWKERRPGLEQIRSLLCGESPESLCIRGITNARVARVARALEMLDDGRAAGASVPATVGELREGLRHMLTEGLDPQELWALSDELPYRVEISWMEHDAPGSFDVLFRRHTAVAESSLERAEAFSVPRHTESHPDWSDYANNPLRGKFARQIAPQLRNFLREQLPDYMVPSGFVLLDNLPLTPGGKVDLRALPSPDRARRENSQPFVAPVTPLEKSLAEVWTAVLGITQAGLHDNFFESGGHSLLATQLISRLRELFQVEIQLRQLFEHPTIAGIAGAIEKALASRTQLQEQTIVPVTREARRLKRASLPRTTKQ